MSKWAIERAAQLWCRPGLSDRLMDVEMCEAIAKALMDADAAGFRRGVESSAQVCNTFAVECELASKPCHYADEAEILALLPCDADTMEGE